MTDPLLIQARQKLDINVAAHLAAQQTYYDARLAFVQADDDLQNAEQAQKLIQAVAQIMEVEAHARISGVVTKCLQTVFGDRYTFKIGFEKKRGKTEAKLKLVRYDGTELDDPLNEAGGGIIDVAAFGLRLACIVLQRPPLRRLLVMDEPFKCIRGKEYRNRVRQMLVDLSNDLGVQFIICVDHEAYPQFLLGKVVEVVGE